MGLRRGGWGMLFDDDVPPRTPTPDAPPIGEVPREPAHGVAPPAEHEQRPAHLGTTWMGLRRGQGLNWPSCRSQLRLGNAGAPPVVPPERAHAPGPGQYPKA